MALKGLPFSHPCTYCLLTRCLGGIFGSCLEENIPLTESSGALPVPISCELVDVTSSFSPETDTTWIKRKKNDVSDLEKQRAVNWARTWPLLNFCQKQPCPSLSVHHTDLILPLCHSLVPRFAALTFANSEYVIVSEYFLSIIFMTLRLTLVYFLPTKNISNFTF